MNPKDVAEAELDAALDAIRWGDYQREDGSWGYGIANRAQAKQKLRAWGLRERKDELERQPWFDSDQQTYIHNRIAAIDDQLAASTEGKSA